MAKIAANNPFVNLTAKPEDIRITWPQQTLVSTNAQVTVVGYRNPWVKPYLKKVEFLLNNHNLDKYLLLYSWGPPRLKIWGVQVNCNYKVTVTEMYVY